MSVASAKAIAIASRGRTAKRRRSMRRVVCIIFNKLRNGRGGGKWWVAEAGLGGNARGLRHKSKKAIKNSKVAGQCEAATRRIRNAERKI